MGQRLFARQTEDRAGRRAVSRAGSVLNSGERLDAGVGRDLRGLCRKAGPIRPAPKRAGANLSDEAIWLGRLVASLLPRGGRSPRASRPDAACRGAPARHAEAVEGDYVPLAEQGHGHVGPCVDRGSRSAAAPRQPRFRLVGRYQLEAAVQSAHAGRAGSPDAPIGPAIERLYDALLLLTGSPVVAINRAGSRSRETSGRRGGPCGARYVGRRYAAGRISTLLGGARARAAGADGRRCGG